MVRKVVSLKPKDESISSFVRGLIEKEHRERKFKSAVAAYQHFLEDNPEERKAMEAWASAPLARKSEPPRQ